MRKIIVFGNVPLATWVVKEILKRSEYELIGIVCDKYSADNFAHHGMIEKSLYSFCVEHNLKILEFDEAGEIAKKGAVLGISVRYHRLFKTSYFTNFSPGIINLHGGELPRYRGANIANYAILEDAKQIGGTLHFIAEGIDSGNIVERELIPVTKKLTAFEYFSLTFNALKQAFKHFIDREDVKDASKRILSAPQKDYIEKGEVDKLYYKKGIEENRIKDFAEIENWDELYRLARAYSFPGHEGLILKNGEESIEVRVKKND